MAQDFITDEEMMGLEKKGVAKSVLAPDFIPDSEADSFFGIKQQQAPSDKSFRFDVPPPVPTSEDRKKKIERLQAEAEQSAKDAKKAGSFFGIAKNTAKGVGETLASSEIGLGKTIAKVLPDSVTKQNVYGENVANLSTEQTKLLKLIREKEKKGEDTTKLKRIFNSNADLIDQNAGEIDNFSKNLPTNGQVAGQIGGTALDLLTAGTYGKAAQGMKSFQLSSRSAPLVTKVATSAGLPEASKLTSKASGLFTKKGALNIAKGAGIGYASDVTYGLQGGRGEDRTGPKAFIPGLGTAIGTAIPLISESVQSVKNLRDPELKVERLIEKRTKELDKLDRLQTIKNQIEKGRERGIDIKKVLANEDVLHGAVDKTGKITTKGEGGAIDMYRKLYVDDAENIVSEALKKEGVAISPETVYMKLKQTVMDSGIEGAELDRALAKIDREMAGYTRRAGSNGVLPLSVLHDAKVDKYSNINFMTDPSKAKYDKAVARALKELVEDHTKSIDVNKVNKELSKHFAVLGYLEKLDGRIVEGGKLGKYFASTIGGMVGSHFGPLGTIVGAEAGAQIKGNMMSKVFSGKTGKIAPQAEAIIDAKNYIKKPPVQLPGRVQDTSSSLNSLGNRQINQATTKTPRIKGISTSSIPEETYTQQGKREIKEIAGQTKDYAKNLVKKPKIDSKTMLGAVGAVGLGVLSGAKKADAAEKTQITKKDESVILPTIFGEMSNRSPEKQELEARVILSTILNRQKEHAQKGKNLSLGEIVAQPNQYQAYKGKQYDKFTQLGDKPTEAKKEIAKKIWQKLLKEVEAGTFKDVTKGAVYYVHKPDGSIEYDNKRKLYATTKLPSKR